MEKIFIGVAWPYANGALHLGHIAGSLLPPDIFARYHRMKGSRVLMVSGSDEHGTPITLEAEKQGKTPKEFVDYYHKEHVECLKKLGISFDLFSRTTNENHAKVVQDMFLTLLKKDYIYKKKGVALYCDKCKRWLPDRYVEGKCPHCNFENARGDQCEKCGKTLNADELVEPRCKICNTEPDKKETEQFFLKLSAFKEQLTDYMKDKKFWKENVYKFTMNWIKSLEDRPITRNIEWGVKIPLEGYDDKRIYVWFDAVTGYLSTSKEFSFWEDFWKDKNAKHYYFIGKDNIPFHTIIWPSMLLGYGGLNLPYNVPANEFLTLKGETFSKSRKRAVWLPEYLKYFEPEPLRYYLSINMPENRDVDFSWDDFIMKNNNELVATLGNFIHRVLTFTKKNFGKIPEAYELDDLDKNALKKIDETFSNTERYIENCEF
ncbi:MAG: methionine--tRNA ligase, partial [Thermoplasmatales archaeon]|nr:methionine--tRNA ligase [Thermoplasmatales archaeon]